MASAHLHPVNGALAPARPKPPVSRPGRGVPARPVRAHLNRKIRQGATPLWLAQQSGVSHKTVLSVLHGERPSLYRGTAEALLAVTATPPPLRQTVDPTKTIDRIDDLVANHWQVADIARAAGLSESTLQPSNLRTGISARTEAAVERVWQVYRDRPGRAPQTYPWLVEQVRAHPVDRVAAGAGVSRSSVERLRHGHPVSRDVARRTSMWLQKLRAEDIQATARHAA